MTNLLPESTTRGVLCKKVFLEISKIHRKTLVPESFFNKVSGLRPKEMFMTTTLKNDVKKVFPKRQRFQKKIYELQC